MREFFHGWRRKFGVVTLVIACALAGIWIRSRAVEDVAAFTISDRLHMITSSCGRLTWWACNGTGGPRHWLEWTADAIEQPVPRDREHWVVATYFVPGSDDPERNRVSYWTLRYYSIAIPITLLSAYLILWKPRKKDRRPPQS